MLMKLLMTSRDEFEQRLFDEIRHKNFVYLYEQVVSTKNVGEIRA